MSAPDGPFNDAVYIQCGRGGEDGRFGAVVLVAHIRLTSSRPVESRTGSTLDQCVLLCRDVRKKEMDVNPAGCFGRLPWRTNGRAQGGQVTLGKTKAVHGFSDVSGMERSPVPIAIRNTRAESQGLKLNGAKRASNVR